MRPFDTFGAAAERLSLSTLISGRHAFQADTEQFIASDVSTKLLVGTEGTGELLEIGCGVGTLLNPLSRHVRTAIGIDHPSCIAKYRELGVPPNVSLLGGEWPFVKPQSQVDRVLVYSVLHYLSDNQAALDFIWDCLDILRPGGALFLGDLPNEDKRRRFLGSAFGKRFQTEWAARANDACLTLCPEAQTRNEIFAQMERPKAPFITDAFILEILHNSRRDGHQSYVVSQPVQLPFSFSREDILIWKGGRE